MACTPRRYCASPRPREPRNHPRASNRSCRSATRICSLILVETEDRPMANSFAKRRPLLLVIGAAVIALLTAWLVFGSSARSRAILTVKVGRNRQPLLKAPTVRSGSGIPSAAADPALSHGHWLPATAELIRASGRTTVAGIRRKHRRARSGSVQRSRFARPGRCYLGAYVWTTMPELNVVVPRSVRWVTSIPSKRR